MSNQKHTIFHGKFMKGENGKLIPVPASRAKYDAFLNTLVEGQTVNIFMKLRIKNGLQSSLIALLIIFSEFLSLVNTWVFLYGGVYTAMQ